MARYPYRDWGYLGVMAKYRKKPVVVEAQQWFPSRDIPSVRFTDKSGLPYVATTHGHNVYLRDGDWVITARDGIHAKVCKPDIFKAMYEPVGENDNQIENGRVMDGTKKCTNCSQVGLHKIESINGEEFRGWYCPQCRAIINSTGFYLTRHPIPEGFPHRRTLEENKR